MPLSALLILSLMAIVARVDCAQQYKYQTLKLTDGYPLPDTVEKIYDNLDRSRALRAYLLALPIVEQAGMRDALRKFGPDNQNLVAGRNRAAAIDERNMKAKESKS